MVFYHCHCSVPLTSYDRTKCGSVNSSSADSPNLSEAKGFRILHKRLESVLSYSSDAVKKHYFKGATFHIISMMIQKWIQRSRPKSSQTRTNNR
ncbi:hypothetical protein FGIG_08598 [Fasciola gigantica]|uniref:Uncharacterized protein n=1 Tax=Fasciola gigantica TaxID=46835 RepID=A0A504Z2C6_FASGI|nr:hypothetical protein FGIG_08598 [Fasciola gigantica]